MATTARPWPASTGWFTSSRSNNGNQCVEVRFDGDAVLIRDSKYRRNPANRTAEEPVITVNISEWTSFLTHLKAGTAPFGLSLFAGDTADGGTALRHGATVLTYTPAEWNAFLAGVRDGEFDRIMLPA
ncbi:DUF397 domain-containing protein [Nocardia arthritidis]|uniref:DUF397 domain-containing protein n=1 Tax=Nocardia arthritidis TaxID=228602 RepID=A0A6G9YU36_9NOCA|nr:DUF397 domain-containing protein [Nocardia arthritidis]QIS16849.1 DUF397 domain-containing protein [Nocardia arthritidis]